MRRSVLILVGLAALAGCGDDKQGEAGGGSAPKPMAITATGSGKNIKITAPKAVPAGLTQINFRNSAKQGLGPQLLKIDGDHTVAEVAKAGSAWGDKGKPLAPWLGLAGGAPRAEPGKRSTATQVLSPGRYYAVDIETSSSAEFEVTGDVDKEAKLPSAAGGTVTASEYKFETSGLKAGNQPVLFKNAGKQPHFMVALPIKQGKTIADVRKFIQTEKGAPPVDENGAVDTPVLDGGDSQVARLNLKKTGNYALLCFIPDREGGPPHAAKGMISEGTVR